MKHYALTRQQRKQMKQSFADLKAGRTLRLSGIPTVKTILKAARKKSLLPKINQS
jgi:hypothetical protein